MGRVLPPSPGKQPTLAMPRPLTSGLQAETTHFCSVEPWRWPDGLRQPLIGTLTLWGGLGSPGRLLSASWTLESPLRLLVQLRAISPAPSLPPSE